MEGTDPVGTIARREGGTEPDYRRIGRRHLQFALAMGAWGGLDALLLRTALIAPELLPARTYDALFTTHGLTMLFLFALPAIWGFAYAVVPAAVGADRLAFARAGRLAVRLLPAAALGIRAGAIGRLLGLEVAPVATGWTFYPPLSTRMSNPAVDLALVGLLAVVASTVLTAGCLLATVRRRRTVRWLDLDLFTWSVLTAAAMAVLSFPVLAAAAVFLLSDRLLATGFFAGSTGSPLLWQHLFWFFAHPLVYVLVLPPMGIVSHVVARFSGRQLVGRRTAIYATLAIGVLSFTVWGHHMFATGMDPRARIAFMYVTLAVALPSSIKAFGWLATLWRGTVRLTAPMEASIAAIGFFTVGGVTGVALAAVPLGAIYNGTHYVVAHFHFMLAGFVGLAVLAGAYYWFPLLTGRWYDPRLAALHLRLTAVGIAVAFAALLALGLAGLPRRAATYPAAYAPLHQLATVGAALVAVGQLLFVWNLLRSARSGPPAPVDPWAADGGPRRTTTESP
ncbi:cbb3-type cytochrome c oxidase subunit I [Saliphagus sp. LR7]|uniref:cytochrome c oxidase subunit I n=1 Tax=Saliphagus sp. LR7 TaxID=2282654 RepID=UPI000DF7A377|nr:cbb3-type cytochrome c oxidase subunit I [Saliphagus sp. LR7]